jgi:putative endonuclease
MNFVYIIQSLKNKRYYIGSTINLERKLMEHNSGKSKYTRLTKPFKLVYKESYKILSEARKREAYLKKLKSRKYICW